jgi:hypothetical protein
MHIVKDTVADACWCRLMAEEIRTEAEGFGSRSAKEIMRIAAESWDRIAESIERSLSGAPQPDAVANQPVTHPAWGR